MNAFIRNKAEKDFLEAVKRIGELLDSELKIETEAYKEGGLKELIVIAWTVERVRRAWSRESTLAASTNA